MKCMHHCVGLAVLLSLAAARPGEARDQASLVGGYAAASVTAAEVVAAAEFAVAAEAKALQEKKDAPPPKLELVRILGAQQQVVAGMNYRLTLKVKLNGVDREAEAVVWWQAWRTPDPYQLTAWTWK